jgi:hypothetical protein
MLGRHAEVCVTLSAIAIFGASCKSPPVKVVQKEESELQT